MSTKSMSSTPSYSIESSAVHACTSPMSCSSFPQNLECHNSRHHHRQQQEPHHHRHVQTRATLKQMRRLEVTTYKRPLARELPEPFNGLWRQQIVEWMYTLVKYCKLRHESAAAASYYLDVAVSRGLVHSPSDYQLGAMTALYLALKVYDSPSMRIVKLSSLVKLGNGEFNEQDILRMERDLVQLLGWHLNPPTPNCFLQQYLTLLPHHTEEVTEKNSNISSIKSYRDSLEEHAFKAIEVAMARDYFLAVPPSVIGHSALLMAIETMDQQQHQRHQFQHIQHHPQVEHPPNPELQQLPPSASLSAMTLVDLQTFLWNMAHVARLDNASPCLVRTSILIDRAMKSLPIPAGYTEFETVCCCELDQNSMHHPDCEDHMNVERYRDNYKNPPPLGQQLINESMSSMGDVQFLDAICEDGYSPNHVVLQ
mmetsp:Transcript_22747/g.40374  ORF Transcript_22747/g.40374 Transcript_22747/m.40374 type:complete len:425 (-) Transcript_22747:253-1527(-)